VERALLPVAFDLVLAFVLAFASTRTPYGVALATAIRLASTVIAR
jgi:hypothetical protein